MKKELGDKVKAPRFLLGPRIDRQTLAEPTNENIWHLATEMNRRMINVELLVADADLKAALDQLMTAWRKFVNSWFALDSLAKNWDAKKPSDDSVPPEISTSMGTLSQLLTRQKEFKSAAYDYFVRQMRA